MEINQLMRRYAWKGVGEWSRADQGLQKNAHICVGGRIAENPTQANLALDVRHNNDPRARFIPMPRLRCPSVDVGFFFAPVCQGNVVSFDLVCVAGSICFGLRFEPPGEGTHRYAHFQFTSNMLGKAHPLSGMPPLPESYPAFPTGTSDTVQLFLYLVTAVHGYHGGALELLGEIFREASMTHHLAEYTETMRRVLGVTAEPGHQ